MLHKVLASLLALFTIAFCPAAFAGSYGEVQLSPSYKTTYVASSPTYTAVASATDVFTIAGSSTKTIKVLKIFAEARGAGTTSFNSYYLIKRSTADSSGTSTEVTAVPLDSANAAATAAVKRWTANPTLGTTVGQTEYATIWTSLANSGTAPFHQAIFDADKFGQAVVLRGTAEMLAVNCNGSTPNSTTVQFTVVWTEE